MSVYYFQSIIAVLTLACIESGETRDNQKTVARHQKGKVRAEPADCRDESTEHSRDRLTVQSRDESAGCSRDELAERSRDEPAGHNRKSNCHDRDFGGRNSGNDGRTPVRRR